jgi:hypothetical protein
MTSKEWVNQNTNDSLQDWVLILMERYANHKTNYLQAKILDWRNNYLKYWSELENSEAEFAGYILDQFDLFFDITTERNENRNEV